MSVVLDRVGPYLSLEKLKEIYVDSINYCILKP